MRLSKRFAREAITAVARHMRNSPDSQNRPIFFLTKALQSRQSNVEDQSDRIDLMV